MGGRGGINILGQKKWHVWNMDNRLRVERDERRHREQQEAAQREEQQGRFQDKVATLKRKNRGAKNAALEDDAITKHLEDQAASRRATKNMLTNGSSSSSSSSTTAALFAAASATLGEVVGEDDSDLKKAPEVRHVNFFQEEEKAWKDAELARAKKVELQAKGRILGKKGTLDGMSVQREMSSDIADIKKQPVPWYMKTGQQAAGAAPGGGRAASSSSSNKLLQDHDERNSVDKNKPSNDNIRQLVQQTNQLQFLAPQSSSGKDDAKNGADTTHTSAEKQEVMIKKGKHNKKSKKTKKRKRSSSSSSASSWSEEEGAKKASKKKKKRKNDDLLASFDTSKLLSHSQLREKDELKQQVNGCR
ncbi:unnamed protein product [Amoebophrya sp. A120]|nr:unnamed protein product [Amoebophrya sp. A120]|eukprot:GSA120T00025747001.1